MVKERGKNPTGDFSGVPAGFSGGVNKKAFSEGIFVDFMHKLAPSPNLNKWVPSNPHPHFQGGILCEGKGPC